MISKKEKREQEYKKESSGYVCKPKAEYPLIHAIMPFLLIPIH